MAGEPGSEPVGEGQSVPPHPNVPKRGAVALAFAGVVLSGVLGALIGWGLVDTSCTGGCGPALAAGAVIGGAAAATGAGIVAVLVLRAMAEWKQHPPDAKAPPRAPRA